ncbi:hypothetical protein [Vitiosangium sp. GDMCC 1.1324]|uniref:hypothetical protein n=1 Tax=Vitiosangium sp. (strain GDMCC 1.1324) TaxID=2138576 RepID=UPI000D33F203|nr:hypothetical protein [Vitiosangium sp. GDMCC 1.1324]PTL85892.1 hypothetical protein DAT35_04165 [Vitiosangium sp. GDMCC 1.1324]
MESLLRGVLVLFVLSLGAERLAAVFKRRDWQPLRPRLAFGKRKKKSGNIQIDLRTGEAYVDSKPVSPVALGSNEVDRLTRAAHSENTLFIGLILALLTGANAFTGSSGWPDVSELRFAFVAQVLLTGAASAVGASFWYELLNWMTESRRARSALASQVPANLSPLLPGSPVVAPLPSSEESAPGPFDQLRAAALRKLPELQRLEGVKQVRLVDAPRRWPTHPCLEFRVEQAPGAPALPGEIKVSVDGLDHSIPVTT